MDEKVKRDIISVLNQTLVLIEKKEYTELKELSNHTIHNASIYQDEDSIQVAVIIYALSKILERAELQNQKLSFNITKTITSALNYISQDNEQSYHSEMDSFAKTIAQSDDKLVMYVQNVIEKAHISKGGSIYGHGISLGRVAEMLGVTQWDLMSFIGKTKIADNEQIFVDAKKRLEYAKKLFKVL